MKIYFAGSIRGGRDDVEYYKKIIELLSRYGTVLTEHIGNDKISNQGEKLSVNKIHNRDLGWLLSSDVVVSEVTNPSLGVGYEIGRAVENNKRVICLYRKSLGKNLSAMIDGSDKLEVVRYKKKSDLSSILKKLLSK